MRGMGRRVIDQGQLRWEVMRALARGDDQQTVADAYSVGIDTVKKFAVRYAATIKKIAIATDNEYAGVWIADKRERILSLQDDVEAIDQSMILTDDNGDAVLNADGSSMRGVDDKLLRVKHAALRQVAEEMGDLKQSVDVTAKLNYEVVGVLPDALS